MKTEELLGGRLLLRQEEGVFPLSADTMALADFACPKRGERLLDPGCGSGALCLLLMGKTEGLRCTGIDCEEQAVRLARENLALNGLAGEVLCGDLRRKEVLPAGAFDYAACNPPFFGEGVKGTAARTGLCLEELLTALARTLKNGGKLALVYPADRLTDLMHGLREKDLEPKRLRMVAHSPGKQPRRVLVEAVKGGKPGLTLLPQLCWYTEAGEKTADYRRIYHEGGENDSAPCT